MTTTTNKAVLFFLIAVTAIMVPSAVYAQELPPPCVGCEIQDPRDAINESLLNDIQITVLTDKEQYDHDDTVRIIGQVANPGLGYDVMMTVTNPLYNIVIIDQLTVTPEGKYRTVLSTAGQAWKYNGQYIIDVYYGTSQRDNSVKIEMTGQFNDGFDYEVVAMSPVQKTKCGDDLEIDDQCVPFSIEGGVITNAVLNMNDKSIVLDIESTYDGVLVLTIDKSIQDGIFMALVDGEESDDVWFDGDTMTILFPAGTEQIEIFGTFLIPEFGTIAVMILVVAIVSVIAVSSRSRLSIMPMR